MYDVPEGTSHFTIGRAALMELATKLEFVGGMTHADAVESAFDHFLSMFCVPVVRVGEVFVPDEYNSPAEALCAVNI